MRIPKNLPNGKLASEYVRAIRDYNLAEEEEAHYRHAAMGCSYGQALSQASKAAKQLKAAEDRLVELADRLRAGER